MERTYPHGVTCWVDVEAPDPKAASRFYGDLFGWTFEDAVPPDVPGSYLIARLDGLDAAAIGPGEGEAAWNTYVAVQDADATAAAVTAAGGTVLTGPDDAGPGGRTATCADPEGARFRLWQPRRRLGAQVANTPGAWNFSDLHAADPATALAFYAGLFGWVALDLGPGSPPMLQVPGYGDHLAATSDPGIHERQAFAPDGFADVIGRLDTVPAGRSPHWQVVFAVADRDETVATAERLGGSVVSSSQSEWTRMAVLRDPQGAVFTASQFTPPD